MSPIVANCIGTRATRRQRPGIVTVTPVTNPAHAACLALRLPPTVTATETSSHDTPPTATAMLLNAHHVTNPNAPSTPVAPGKPCPLLTRTRPTHRARALRTPPALRTPARPHPFQKLTLSHTSNPRPPTSNGHPQSKCAPLPPPLEANFNCIRCAALPANPLYSLRSATPIAHPTPHLLLWRARTSTAHARLAFVADVRTLVAHAKPLPLARCLPSPIACAPRRKSKPLAHTPVAHAKPPYARPSNSVAPTPRTQNPLTLARRKDTHYAHASSRKTPAPTPAAPALVVHAHPSPSHPRLAAHAPAACARASFI
ncbi:hypothetical protein K438DRAFT_1944138 [Mycena galopus ATCC 62051]|nr:hypothetical protein K438DRAFT_1944138 [Mycena galopus ATCC 62051]